MNTLSKYEHIINNLILQGRIGKFSRDYNKIKPIITYNQDTVDVEGYVDLSSMHLTEIPVPFGITDFFSVSNNRLKNLKNGPRIAGLYNASHNSITDISNLPIQCETLRLEYNYITKLEIENLTCNKIVAYSNNIETLRIQNINCKELYIENNHLKNLIGCSNTIEQLVVDFNPLESFAGISKNLKFLSSRFNIKYGKSTLKDPFEILKCLKLHPNSVYIRSEFFNEYKKLYYEQIEDYQF